MSNHNIIKELAALLDVLDIVERRGTELPEATVAGITDDSRAVAPGYMFVAVRGVSADGHRFIAKAVEAGASVIVAEEIPADAAEGVLWIRVPDTKKALGLLASRYYGDPSEELTLVGVTGTNGKTTVATLLYETARLTGHRAGLISTVVNIVGSERIPADHTTPHPLLLNSLLRRMVDAGCTFAAMEVSSHAADQHRIAGLNFAGGIFTNLTRDHLDYHKTFEAYLHAKKSFFDMLPATAFALVNADDRNGGVMVQNTAASPRATFSTRGVADFRARVVEDRLDGMLIDFDGREVETLFVGSFNASNLCAVYGAALLLGWPREEVLPALSRLVPVAGRFQPFRSADGVVAIVDFAHTPDALVNVLDTIREVARDESRVITVCGAGGDRDRGKRPRMAAEASLRSDVLILTSDNPRSEDPLAIIEEMKAGLSAEALERTVVVPDRREAIGRAVSMAAPGDIVLVAGKGHETEQIIGTVRHHFDDCEEVRAALDSRSNII